ncbi:MAG: hypothetical protein KC476_09030, partial [Cyanobacteria bacterium HKST-UBA06]|nr:hypothetical protein [Cyanobacteria bacterium HKST-UBA06]
MPAPLKPLLLPKWVHWTKTFQETALINRGTLDAVGYALPMVLLTRNAVERKEKMVDRTITIGSAFLLAPLHAYLFYRLFSRGLPSKHLMKLPFKALTSNRAFHAGLKELQKTLLQDSRGKLNWAIPKGLLGNNQAVTRIRHKLINNKTHMLLWDLMTEAMIFTNIGFINNWVSRKTTGKNRFVGEIGAASDAELDALHQARGNDEITKADEMKRHINNSIVAIVTPLVIALGLKRGLKNPKINHPFIKALRTVAHSFDYKKGIYLGMGSLVVVVGMQFLGYITAARSKYELMERTLQEAWANYLFFLGEPTWTFLLGRALFNREQRPLVHSIKSCVD